MRRTAIAVLRIAEFARSEGIWSEELADCCDSLRRLSDLGPDDILRVETAGVATALLNAIDAGYRDIAEPRDSDGNGLPLSLEILGCPSDRITSWAIEDSPQCLRDFLPVPEIRHVVVVPHLLAWSVSVTSQMYFSIEGAFVYFCRERDIDAGVFA